MILRAVKVHRASRIRPCPWCGETIGLSEQHVQVLWENDETGHKHRGPICITCARTCADEKIVAAAG